MRNARRDREDLTDIKRKARPTPHADSWKS
jgi:hypothetical protein